MPTRIALLGVGLIGGSLGLAWHRYRPDCRIVGYDTPEVLDRALHAGVIDERAATPGDAVRDADVVVLATPIGAAMTLLDQIAPHLSDGALVTDVCSVKRPVVEHAAAVLPAHVRFVGGHPMAGAERGGVEHADLFLFENAAYVLCPPDDVAVADVEAAYPELVDLVEATGARALVLSAERHDRIAATVSHLPQLLAVLLMRSAAEHAAIDPAVLTLAAGGFRDMTRIASSPFAPWRDILLANEGAILDALARFAAGLQQARNRLIEEDLDALDALFHRARTTRQSVPTQSKGFLHPLADVYVSAEDRPGVLHAITGALHEAELNVKDIELLKIREGTGGTFRVGFATDDDARAAREALKAAGFALART